MAWGASLHPRGSGERREILLKILRFWVVAGLALPGLALTGCGDDDRPEIDAGETDAETMDASGMDADMRIDAELPELDGDVPLDGGEDDDAGSDPDGGVDGGMEEASCSDGRRNGDETGVDCGGATCTARCPDLGRCTISSDCTSRVCIGGTCIVPSCMDGVNNGSETGADCGGVLCPGCGLGQGCMGEEDCAAGTCSGGFCVADHCFDGTRNVNETDVDCGGADCGPCDAGQQCRMSRDCNMSMCEGGFCLTPECSNGVPDEGEVDVDCGGECPGCDDGTACTMGVDCLSGRCEGAICTSCFDGVRTGAETGMDCGGGVCRGCGGGQGCNVDDDCGSRSCVDGTCEGAALYYREDFTTDGGWTVEGGLWEHAAPAGTALSTSFDGSPVWITDANADYTNNADAHVTSPMIVVSGTMDPVVRLATLFESESSFDLTWLEMSIDGGPFERVGSRMSGGTNWYNSTRSSPSAEGWAGSAVPVWRVAQHPLVGAAGHTIQLRIRFSSDDSFVYEGFAFDNIFVADPELFEACENGLLDSSETDVDCGGEFCDTCDDGLDCTGDLDCASGTCDFGTCVSCDDGIENGDETDLDCGGPSCAPCNDTQTCVMGTDCLSGRCEAGACTSCFDGVQNGGETFIDCGGGGCGLCLGGAGCTANEQCLSGTCDAGVCTTPPSTSLEWTFDTDGEGWTVGGTVPSWEYGVPATADLSSAYTGTGVWITNADGDYNANEQSWVQSPSFSLAGVARDPELQLAIAYVLEGSVSSAWEAVWVEVSTDGGTMWRTVSNTVGGGANWYNGTWSSNAMQRGWVASSPAWRVASTVLAGTAGQADVRIRVRMGSDFGGVRQGFAFDDVRILPSTPDLAVSLAPSANVCDGALVTVRNQGSQPVSFFDLLTNVDGTMSTTRVTRLLDPGASYTVELRAAMNLEASVRAVGDSDPSNDTAMYSTTARTIGARYVETFEAGAGDWVTTGTNSSWAWGTPSDTFITNANSGSRAWVTGLTTDYRASEQSYLVSPCFDFSGFGTDPTLSFSYIHDTEPTNDHAFVEISTDGGATWEKLGLFGTGANWYNDLAGDFWDGRSGAAGVWLRASHPLTGAAGSAAVRVRVSFVSNATTQREGFGVDDVILMP